jgi:hypothetical protein
LELENDLISGVEEDKEVANNLEVKNFDEFASDNRVHFYSILVTLESNIGRFRGLSFVLNR